MNAENKQIELIDITKNYDGEDVLKNINLYIKEDEFLTLLGPSGCGKTTTLRLIAGFEYPTNGKILFDGQDITDMPPYKRRVNTVFQRYALFPHMNVAQNIAFGPNLRKEDRKKTDKRVSEMLELVGLKGYEKRAVDALSGGQQQRVAIARALINQPDVLLLDEPLGALDLKLRKEMQGELKKMQQHLGITFVYVTHDQEEALTMSDEVVVLKDGIIQQIGTPVDIYNEPKNAFVADFIGESNILDGMMEKDLVVHFDGHRFECVDSGFGNDKPVDVVVRPEDIYIVDEEHGMVCGQVTSLTFKGVHNEMFIHSDDGFDWMVHDTGSFPVGSRVGLIIRPDDIHIMKKGVQNA
ncbi:Spermidine/putrescine import ATP-binding protein PotA [uncultured Clostridium sp.]|nr:Spermidine/putrescine import ATP-binding protein PotA [uncultured Clostridium sp.]